MSRTEWKSKKINLGSAIIACAVTFVIGIILSANWGTYAPFLGGKISSSSISWSGLNEVYSSLVANYDGEIDNSAIVEGAKKGLVDSVGDAYTVFMTNKESQE